MNLIRCIKDRKIEFYGIGRKLDAALDDFGEGNCNLVRHLSSQSNAMIVKGEGLEHFLTDPANLDELAAFLVQLISVNENGRYHVDVDIYAVDKQYPKTKLIRGRLIPRQQVDGTHWLPSMPHFERAWNFSLESEIADWVGLSGYERSENEKMFKYRVAQHAMWFLIGTKSQLDRYNGYLDVRGELYEKDKEKLKVSLKLFQGR